MISILEDLEQKNPNAIYMYSSDLAEIWSTDKDNFIRSVAKSRGINVD